MDPKFFSNDPAPEDSPDLFSNEPAPEDKETFLGNVSKNAQHMVKGGIEFGKQNILHPIDAKVNFVKGLPGAIVGEGKRVGAGELLTGHPIEAAKKFGHAFYEEPITTALDVLPFAEGAAKMVGSLGEAGKAAELGAAAGEAGAKAVPEMGAATESVAPGVGADLSRVAEGAPRPVEIPGEASDILRQAGKGTPPPTESVPPGRTFGETVQNLTNKIPGAVKQPVKEMGEYLEQKFSNVAGRRPHLADTMADYMKEHGQNMTLKELRASSGQIRKIGIDRARQLADYALENGLVGPKTGTIGRGRMIAQKLEDAGASVGGFRKMAADRGAVHNVDNLIDQVRSQLDQKYMTPGLHSGERGAYMRALMDLKKAPTGSAADISEKVSELFQESKKLDRLKRPSGPVADVASQVRKINHDLISNTLSKEELALYEKSLEDYGALRQINEFFNRGEALDASGRLGPGSGISRAAVQKFLDSVGYRTEAKIATKLSDWIRKNPEIATRPRDIFRKFGDEAAEAVDEMGVETNQ